MLNFSHLSLRRGTRELLRDVNCILHAGQKVGLTGANGAGKSSLFALIRGLLQPDQGDFTMPPATVIAHVAQETPAVDQTALDYVLDGDAQLRQIEADIEQAAMDDQGEKLGELYAELDAIDGYTAASRAGKLMQGLGFSADQEQTAVREFSGGWRMRLNLAQALMCRSDLLLLDEPTNHLDLEAVIWLEEWLRGYAGTLILISHDRDFLDRITTHIAHIEQAELTLYTGNYSAFEIRRAEKLANQQAAFEKQQREIAHVQSYVDRFRAKASKARQAQSRLKALERMEVISQAHVDSPFHFEFKPALETPHSLLQLEHVNAGYGDTVILSDINLTITQGDRIGLLGHNGAGKSTLIKLLAGDIAPLAGEISLAKNIRVGYFAQHQLEQLDDDASPLLHLQRIDKKATEQQLRNFLGGFAFNSDMATGPVAPFSGGEKARLVLAMLVYQRPNLLLLDEPTNHLDLEMRHALSMAMQGFDGAMVVVSHDRHLLRTVTDALYLVDGGKAEPFEGDLDDYRQWVRDQASANAASQKAGKKKANEVKKKSKTLNSDEKKQQQALSKSLQKIESKMEKLKKSLADLESKLSEDSLYEPSQKTTLQTLLSEQEVLREQSSNAENEWLEISEALEQFN